MTIAVPYEWLKQAPLSLLEKGDAPLFGYPPAFPWDQFSAVFAKVFQIESLKIVPGEWKIREPVDLYKGLGDSPTALHLDVAPLQGTLCWVITENDLNKLLGLLLAKKSDPSDLIDSEYKAAFLQFLGLEAINIFNKLEYEKGLAPHILNQTDLPNRASLCQDFTITVDNSAIPCRIILSDELWVSWKERFAQHKLNANISKKTAEKIEVTVHLEAGRTSLSRNEWKNAELGDFLVLDHCSLEAGEDKGRVMLTLNNKPLFRAKVKDGNIKILESPLYHEVESGMINKNDPNDEVEFNEEEFDEDFDEELEEGSEEHEIEEEAPQVAQEAPKAPPTATKSGIEKQPVGQKKPLSAADIPLSVIVEVGRIQISVQKLLELQPGSVLELDVHPESGVDLVVNGSVIGRGELLKIGDSLGVRILDKG